MRLSLIRSGLVAAGAAVALAACSSGQSVVPPQSGAPALSNGAAEPATTSILNPFALTKCQQDQAKTGWALLGSCVIGKITSGGETIKLPPYKGISVKVKFPKNTAKGQTPYVFADALGKNDIAKYKTHAFKLYNGNKGVVAYLNAQNGGKAAIQVAKNVIFSLTTATKFPGKRCGLAHYAVKQGAAPWSGQWVLPPQAVAPQGKTLTLDIPSAEVHQAGGLPPGPLYLVVFCVNG